MSNLTASIIINTYNRCDYLGNALKSLTTMDYPDFEVIVVNGPSTDRTEQLLEDWAGKVKHLRCDEPNLSMSRNIGLKAADGDVVAFMDDDAVPHPQWLDRILRVYSDEEVGGVGGYTIDNTGVRYQVRKTICDRYGNAFNVASVFDERALCWPGTPYYPSLLGTNSSFRRTAIRDIGGFDETFAYLLDETDVCIRLVDAGWKVTYEPTALIYHQFAPSDIRSQAKTARTIYPSAVSKSYFIAKHGRSRAYGDSKKQIEDYREEILRANNWLENEGHITSVHRFSLDEDLIMGIRDGMDRLATEGLARKFNGGDLDPAEPAPPFQQFARSDKPRVALVSQSYPPLGDAGIARWTQMVAEGLAELGYAVHVISKTGPGAPESVNYSKGIWVHRLTPGGTSSKALQQNYNIPPNVADWNDRVMRELVYLKSFGLQLVSFPIWDLEALPALDDPDFKAILSLHTTYAMAKPFKPEWSSRPLFEYYTVDRVIAAEKAALSRAPVILANSECICDAIQETYGVDVRDRATIIPHGTLDSWDLLAPVSAARRAEMQEGAPLEVLFVGRFEPRKGFDLAAAAARLLEERPDIHISFVGDVLDKKNLLMLGPDGGDTLVEQPNVSWLGFVEREELETMMAKADVVLTPSRFESFGLVAIEAFAVGTPVIALKVGGLNEVITDGVDGVTVPDDANAHEAIAAAISDLARNRKKLVKMSDAARETFETRYTAQLMVENIAKLYDSLVAPATTKELEAS